MHTNRNRGGSSDIELKLNLTLVRKDELALETATKETIRQAIDINDREIASLREALARIQMTLDQRNGRAELLKRLDDLLNEAEKEQPDQHSVPAGFARRKRERRTSLAWSVRREVYLILKEAGRPLDRKHLYKKLLERGVMSYATDEADALQALTKIMWSAAEFASTPEGYWLAAEPLPET